MRFLVPATTSPGRALLGCGPSAPAAVPPPGFLTPSAVSWQARACGDVSRRCRPWDLPVQSLLLAHSTFTPLGAACSLVVGDRSAWCDDRSLDPPGFSDARVRPIRADGRGPEHGGLVPPGARASVSTRPRGHASPAPSGPIAGLTRQAPAPSTSERCSVRECVHARRRFPVAARSLLSSGSPLQSLRPVLCSGPSCPARSPRACARASRRPGSLTHDVGGEPVPSVLSEVHEGGVPASAIVDVRRRRSCRLSAAVPDPHDLRPGLAPFAWSPGCSSTGPAPVVTVSPRG